MVYQDRLPPLNQRSRTDSKTQSKG
jgi:hypothetical protein